MTLKSLISVVLLATSLSVSATEVTQRECVQGAMVYASFLDRPREMLLDESLIAQMDEPFQGIYRRGIKILLSNRWNADQVANWFVKECIANMGTIIEIEARLSEIDACGHTNSAAFFVTRLADIVDDGTWRLRCEG